MNAIKNTFIINKVDQNGHCGYIAIINGLKEYDINHESATEFRELIHDHINENKSSIYDNMKFSTPISKNNFISTVSRCIYHESMNDHYTSSDHWMDTSKIIPIICHIYKELTFIVYDTKMCTTSSWTYNGSDSCTYHHYNFMKIPSDNCVTLLFNGVNHFDNLFKK